MTIHFFLNNFSTRGILEFFNKNQTYPAQLGALYYYDQGVLQNISYIIRHRQWFMVTYLMN